MTRYNRKRAREEAIRVYLKAYLGSSKYSHLMSLGRWLTADLIDGPQDYTDRDAPCWGYSDGLDEFRDILSSFDEIWYDEDCEEIVENNEGYDEECPDCDGEGDCTYEDGDSEECEYCEGTGEVWVPPRDLMLLSKRDICEAVASYELSQYI